MNIVSRVYAATDPWGDFKKISSITSWNALLGKIYDLFDFFIPFSALVAVIMVVVGGYTLMTAVGDPDKIKKGSGIVTAAVVGMIMVFLSRLFVKFLLDRVV